MAQLLPFDRGARMSAGRDATPQETGPASSGDAEWSQWMRQAQAGDRATYQRLLQALVPYLTAIARRHFGAADGVEDAVQDVLMIVHRVRHTYEPERPFKPWLATIANRHCIDLMRRARRRQQQEAVDPTVLDTHADDAPVPEDALQRERASENFRRTVASLPQRQRTAVELLKLQELSLREASEASGLSIPALKVGVHRAVKSLRRKLGVENDND